MYARKTAPHCSANEGVLRNVCFDSVSLMNQDGRKLENKTPMEIIDMDRNTELKRLL